jgi:hypothetical protein
LRQQGKSAPKRYAGGETEEVGEKIGVLGRSQQGEQGQAPAQWQQRPEALTGNADAAGELDGA